MKIQDYIRNVADFPKKGVQFKDITPLLNDVEARERCLEEFVNLLQDQHIDKVVAVESRGFFFGFLLAHRLKAGFVPIRKAGKLPYHCLSESYDLEYGQDQLEIHQDAIKPGERILLHDDVLATGGTALAACKLVERLGGEIIQFSFLMELKALAGLQKLKKYPVKTLFTF